MTTITDQKTERQYYIDWLRIMLILSVFLYHIGMIFNPWPWHIKNNEQYGGLLCLVKNFLDSWRMPLLFMLSSFTLTTAIYWFLIRPFSLLRVIFGMKILEKEVRKMNKPESSHALVPVIEKDEMYLSA